MDEAEFVNEPQLTSDLPRLSDEAFEPVDPNYLRVSLLSMGLFAGLIVVGGGVATLLVSSRRWLPLVIMVGLLALTALTAVLRIIEVRNIGYQIRTHDLSYRRGVLVKRVSTVPFVRVQHARIQQGPVQRRFGLATLEVNSAGPDLSIDGLSSDVAERMKALVVERAGDLTEDE